MLIRIVRLHFRSEEVERFKEIFHETKSRIESFPGCQKVELYVDESNPNVFYTHSFWDSVDHLNDYRNSDLFNSTWNTVKKLFKEKPKAYSLVSVK